MDEHQLVVRCPTCGKRGKWFEGPYGPFCSYRCKLIDLGRWLDEEYKISEPINERYVSNHSNEHKKRTPQNNQDSNEGEA